MNKNIFNNYETVESALLNELATEARTKGKKARTLKGEGYYVKYEGVKYNITPEQCRIYRLICNNFNMFAEHLNSAKSDILGVWKNVWGERLPDVIAKMEKGLEICQKYFDAFKSFITEEDEPEVASEENETVETEEKNETVDAATDETVAVEAESTSELESTKSEEVDVDGLIRELRVNGEISDKDKIIVNEDENGIDLDIYENGRWRTNIVLYEYD